MIKLNKIYQGDCLVVLTTIPDNSIDCCITSPPYWGLRDYGVDGQLGLEKTPEEFVNKLADIFDEVKRVLKPSGTLWLNLGDSYNSASSNQNSRKEYGSTINNAAYYTNGDQELGRKKLFSGLKPKDLVGVPWMVAFELRRRGWYLRQDIIWHKPNPMPESVTDRCTKAHEYIFLLSKSEKYYYDQEAIRVPLVDQSIMRLDQNIEDQKGSSRVPGKTNGNMKAVIKGNIIGGKKHKNLEEKGQKLNTFHRTRSDGKEWEPKMAGSGDINDGRSGYFDKDGELLVRPTANKKSVWTVTTKPFKEAHFATFPQELIEPCILAGSSEHGCCNVCGNPYERNTEPSERYAKILGEGYHDHTNDLEKGMQSMRGTNKQNKMRDAGIGSKEYVTTGWKSTCKCEASVVPAVVLDPFSGAGTTCMVSKKKQRDYIGIELNQKYVAMSEKRLQKELGLFQ